VSAWLERERDIKYQHKVTKQVWGNQVSGITIILLGNLYIAIGNINYNV